jgi:hypothetical protein
MDADLSQDSHWSSFGDDGAEENDDHGVKKKKILKFHLINSERPLLGPTHLKIGTLAETRRLQDSK